MEIATLGYRSNAHASVSGVVRFEIALWDLRLQAVYPPFDTARLPLQRLHQTDYASSQAYAWNLGYSP